MAKTLADIDKIAMVLVEATFFGDKRTAEKWGIHRTTVSRYRTKLDTDEKLLSLFTLKRQQFETNWTQRIPLAIIAGTDALIKAFQQADLSDPAVIHSIAGAMKIMTEIGLAKEVIDVRLGKFDRENREPGNQVVASVSVSSEDSSS